MRTEQLCVAGMVKSETGRLENQAKARNGFTVDCYKRNYVIQNPDRKTKTY